MNVELLLKCLMVVSNDWYLESIGFDTLVFRTKEGKKVVEKQKTLLKRYLEEYCAL